MKIILMLLVLMVSGCATKIEETIVIEYKYVPVEVPKGLFGECKPAKPITPDKYQSLTNDERLSYLTSYSVSLLGEMKKCDNRLQAVNKYIEQHNATYREIGKGKDANAKKERGPKVFDRKTGG